MSIRTIIGCALLAALIVNAALSVPTGSPVRGLALATAIGLGVIAASGAIAVATVRSRGRGETKDLNVVSSWRRDGALHREGGPALTLSNGARGYYLHGKPHREDGPALTFRDGFAPGGQGDDDPASVDGLEAYFRNGVLHREDGPALTYSNGREFWFRNGQRVDPDGKDTMSKGVRA